MKALPRITTFAFDTYANYGWLYLASFGIGIGAFLVAATFRPFPKLRPAAVPQPA